MIKKHFAIDWSLANHTEIWKRRECDFLPEEICYNWDTLLEAIDKSKMASCLTKQALMNLKKDKGQIVLSQIQIKTLNYKITKVRENVIF